MISFIDVNVPIPIPHDIAYIPHDIAYIPHDIAYILCVMHAYVDRHHTNGIIMAQSLST